MPIEAKINYKDKNVKNLLYFKGHYKLQDIYCAVLNKNKSKYKNIKQIYPWEI